MPLAAEEASEAGINVADFHSTKPLKIVLYFDATALQLDFLACFSALLDILPSSRLFLESELMAEENPAASLSGMSLPNEGFTESRRPSMSEATVGRPWDAASSATIPNPSASPLIRMF